MDKQRAGAQLCGVRSFVSLTCMPQNVPEELSRTIETLYRSESGRILATLARLLGDLDVAEEAMHEAFATALSLWPRSGVPSNPRPWLIRRPDSKPLILCVDGQDLMHLKTSSHDISKRKGVRRKGPMNRTALRMIGCA